MYDFGVCFKPSAGNSHSFTLRCRALRIDWNEETRHCRLDADGVELSFDLAQGRLTIYDYRQSGVPLFNTISGLSACGARHPGMPIEYVADAS